MIVFIALLCCQSTGLTSPENRSQLRPMPSPLASVSYFFQGFPQAVVLTDFAYYDRADRSHEDYIAKLLDSPKETQRTLGYVAAYLASKIYIDDRGQTYLLLGKEDAGYLSVMLYDGKKKDFSWRDNLMHECLQSYVTLRTDRKRALAPWQKKGEKRAESVRLNVGALAAKIIVSDRIDDGWTYPYPAR